MKKTLCGLLVGVLAAPATAQAYCYTVTTDTVNGTAVTSSGEGHAGYVPYGGQRYVKNNSFSPNCKYITNSSSTRMEVYVPAYTQAEWTSFLSKLPSGVATADCSYATSTTCTSSGSGSYSGGGGGGSYGTDGNSYHSTNANQTESASNNPSGASRGGGGGGGSSRVICTHFMRKGMIPQDLWRADLTFTQQHISQATVRGYHFWGIPYVRLMRRSPLAEKIMYHIALARAKELGYQMGIRDKHCWAGVAVRLVLEPISFCIGHFVGEQDWRSVWLEEPINT